MSARFLIIGCGGLGGPIAHALASAGAAELVLCDPDRVELSNLHRQIQFGTADVGRLKVAALADALVRRGYPRERVTAEPVHFNDNNAARLLRRVDVIIDGTDSIPCKFLANDRACAANKPLVIAAVQRYEGQVFAILPGQSACYRCLFEREPDEQVATCQSAGVFGATVAMIAARAAMLALSPRAAAEVYDDLRTSRVPRLFGFRPRAGCPACRLTLGEQTMPTVRIPTPLRKLTEGKEEVKASGTTIGELITDLEKNYPGIKARICDEKGQVRRFVNIFANEEDIRFLKNLDTPVKESDEISIVPAIAGGV